MKVALVVERYPQISETFVVRQAIYLNADVITIKYDKSSADQLGVPKTPFVLAPNIPLWLWRFQKVLHKYYLKSIGGFQQEWITPYKTKLLKRLIDIKPNVVLAQFGPTGINILDLCKKLKLPLVVHFHGYDASGLVGNQEYVKRLNRLFKNAAQLIVVNQVMRELFIKLGCDKSKISLIPCGVPIEDFDLPRSDYHDEFRFLFVGRLVPKKNPLGLVQSFEKCSEIFKNSRLIILGGGPMYRQVEDYVKNSKYTDKIDLKGPMPFELVKEYYFTSDAFIQHSVTALNGDTEGWPVAIAEAMAAGLPVISTKHTGILDQVVHEKTGYLVDEHDTEGMAKYMIQLANNPELCKQMGRRGKIKIMEVGNFSRQAEALKTVLKKYRLKISN